MTSLKIRRVKLNNVLISANPCGHFVALDGGGVELSSGLIFDELDGCKCKIENGKWKIIFPLYRNISSPTREGATHVNIFQNYCKITKNKCVARWGLARREKTTNVIFKSEAFGDPAFCKSGKEYDKLDPRAPHENDKRISSPTGEARWGLARKGGALC